MHRSLVSLAAAIALVSFSATSAASKRAPTEEESAPSPVALWKPIVVEPSPSSELACPRGTTQRSTRTLIACTWRDDVKTGPAIAFYEDGRVRAQGFFENDKRVGTWWEFRADGSVAKETEYVAGMRDGLTVTFYPDGTRGAEAHFRRGKREGVARAWTQGQGKLVAWRRYENDVLVEGRYFR